MGCVTCLVCIMQNVKGAVGAVCNVHLQCARCVAAALCERTLFAKRFV